MLNNRKLLGHVFRNEAEGGDAGSGAGGGGESPPPPSGGNAGGPESEEDPEQAEINEGILEIVRKSGETQLQCLEDAKEVADGVGSALMQVMQLLEDSEIAAGPKANRELLEKIRQETEQSNEKFVAGLEELRDKATPLLEKAAELLNKAGK